MRFRHLASSWALAGSALALSACGGGNGATPQGTLSSFSPRANAVVGGEAMVQLTGVDDASALAVNVNGSKTAVQFRKDPDGRTLALVTSLQTGANTVTVTAGSSTVASLQLRSFPTSGPIFSGPQQTPWVCQTQSFVLPDGTNLPASTAADCSVPSNVQYVYVNTSKAVKPLSSTSVLPADVATTTTSTGAKVNFVIRVETGTLNRGIYQISILHDPTKDQAATPFSRPAGWNGEVVYPFGGGCGPGYKQGSAMQNTYAQKLAELGMGYAVASSTLNDWANNCNSTLSAETAMMVKERFIEAYGVPKATIGQGRSGGSKSQYMIADNYPGILDGILPTDQASGPDGVTANPSTVDCSLVSNYFNKNATMSWTYDQKTAVVGWAGWNNCEHQPTDPPGTLSWQGVYSPYYVVATARSSGTNPGLVGFYGCDVIIPDSYIYNPTTNPNGVRCDVYSALINIWGGITATSNIPRRPMDGVGLQYGLAAFNSGKISADQFVELNEKVGGYDQDGNIVSARSVADTTAIKIAYQTGQVVNGAGGLNNIPIIDLRTYNEALPDFHDRLGSFIVQARLIAANGNADNQVRYTLPPTTAAAYQSGGALAGGAVPNAALLRMSAWLASIRQDTTSDSMPTKVRKNKPADLVDACWDPSGNKIVEPASYTAANKCNALYPIHANPRIVAGMGVKHDVLKCQLKPITASDYQQPITAAQLASLQVAFPQGVCDFSKPGVEQQGLSGTWFGFPTRGQPAVFN
jgi:hypothetical protein